MHSPIRVGSGRPSPPARDPRPELPPAGCAPIDSTLVQSEGGRVNSMRGQQGGGGDGHFAASSCTGKPARRFKDFRWTTRTSWSRRRRVVAKAEWTKDEANPRFVVTSLTRAECKARYLYEKVYCARGDMENRIKECQLDLYADRTSTATMRANQLRLWFASMAYVLLCALRRIGLHHTPFAKATCGTIRLKLLKIGALVRSECPPHQGCDGVSVSCSRYLGLRCQASRRCRQRARPRPPDTRRRNAQPTRHHPEAHRDHFFAAPAAQKIPTTSRVS